MRRLALKLNISLVHPGLIAIPLDLSKDNQMFVKPKICILKGPSIFIPDNSSQNLLRSLKKQQTPSILHSQIPTLGGLTHYL